MQTVRRQELTDYLDSLFRDFACPEDSSRNGLQVQGKDDVARVAFAVDARLETFRMAVDAGADLLFCHHGILWGAGLSRLTGNDGERVRLLMKNDLSLYAMHLPLDAHAILGNNAQLALALGIPLERQTPFAVTRGIPAGVQGDLPRTTTLGELTERLQEIQQTPADFFGAPAERTVNRIAVVSGSGAGVLEDAASGGADAFITGELDHVRGIRALELGMPVVTGGHYGTETHGPKAVMRQIQERFPQLECLWISAPTGL